MKWLALIGFLLTIPAANWMIGHVGHCIPNGPCVIPVGFGLEAPSGVLMVGLALVLRDAVHSLLGARWAVAAILAGAVLSTLLAPLALAAASGAAFLVSEAADMAVYAPLREKRLYLALLLSGIVGAIVDSVVFLGLAFGSLQFVEGQIVGKLLMTIAAMAVLWLIEHRATSVT